MKRNPVVVIGVTGSIAAHKSLDITSQLVKAGAAVHVVLTPDAANFVMPLPFKILSRNPVITSLFNEGDWVPTHISLADQADMLLIAPATANTIAKLAIGIADNALTCIALALNENAKIVVAPAMNGKMWLHPATQKNVDILKSRGVEFIGPEEGVLSCGYEGIGRLMAVDKIIQFVLEKLNLNQ